MSREEIVKQVADYYEIEPDENSFDFTRGFILSESGLYFTLSSTVDCIEEILENIRGGILND